MRSHDSSAEAATRTGPAVGSVTATVDAGVAVLTISNPGARNALTLGMWTDLDRLVRDLVDDPRVLVVVLRGAGDTFSSGADIRELPEDPDEFHRVHLAAEHTIATCPKPVIAAIRGHCVGGGCEIAVAADLRFADAAAVFGVTASRLGIVYPTQPTQRLADLVGVATARRLLFAGELLDAGWALRVGLIDEIVEIGEGDVEARVMAYARLLATRSQTTIMAAKHITAGRPHDVGWSDADYLEGVAAYRERRRPAFPSATLPETGRRGEEPDGQLDHTGPR